ncbi:DUF1641 domain-containing protein [Heyndrickxia acidicola]|uniref:DUF1641 domain-containing protein n=1 Tax=Heyndrickxia acidicola TaxID=209389 RepID=A0ABU6MHJ0_9BACI|nr:DUF1641 domain-containing protein [Heyndrickxia acidicola]MED1203481.1 DUF1641 domain-containing protein [Heyndrickxia acidicola]
MAKAIKQIRRDIPTAEQVQEEAVADILKALADNRDAVMEALALMEQLHKIGVLEAIKALIQNGVDVALIALQQINQPSMYNTIKNAMNALSFLGQVNPDQLQIMLNGVGRGLVKFGENVDKHEKASLWKLGSVIRNDEVKTALVNMIGLLEGMGEVFKEGKQELH